MDDPQQIPMSDQRTLFLVNIFIIHTTRFLSKFSAVCEHKLTQVHRRLLRLDLTLGVLEAKLNSIDGLEKAGEITSGGVSSNMTVPITENAVPSSMISNISSEAALLESTSTMEQESHIPLPSSREEENGPKIKDDPRLAKFFRMLRVGVLEQAVKLQMSIEGLDPSLLDTPNATLPRSDVRNPGLQTL